MLEYFTLKQIVDCIDNNKQQKYKSILFTICITMIHNCLICDIKFNDNTIQTFEIKYIIDIKNINKNIALRIRK